MQLSIIIPLFNEEESLEELNEAIEKVVSNMDIDYELIYIDDGSTDDSWKTIKNLSKDSSNLKGIKFLRNFGKSQALYAGFDKAIGQVVITMDGDLQDDPNEIPSLFDKIDKENFDLVSGWKKKRFDSLIFKNIPSKIFNFAARMTSGIKLNDFNCGLKAYKKSVVKSINVYGQMHRYIPILAKNEGFTKIGEKIVNHKARKHGKTKFGPSRFLHGFLDLLTVWFICSFARRPMHLFGSLWLLMIIRD